MICITLYCNTYCNVASINCFVMCVIWNLMNNPERKVSFDFCFLWRLLMMFATTPGGKSRHSSFSLMICVTNPTSEKSVQETQSHDKLSFRFPSWNHKLLTKGLLKSHAHCTAYVTYLNYFHMLKLQTFVQFFWSICFFVICLLQHYILEPKDWPHS